MITVTEEIRLRPRKIKSSLNKVLLKEVITLSELNTFKNNINKLIKETEIAGNKEQGEENTKNLFIEFLKDSFYKDKHFINTMSFKGRNEADLVIHSANNQESNVSVIFEVKTLKNKSQMISRDIIANKSPNDLLKSAFYESVLYFFHEVIGKKNIELKNIIITNVFEYFIFDASEFKRVFLDRSKSLLKDFEKWKNNELIDSKTDTFYNRVKDYITHHPEYLNNLRFTYFDIREYENDEDLKLLYKVFSPMHLLKQSLDNDSNSLNKDFYNELLHIIGLEEVEQGSQKLIQRKKNPDSASLIENAINIIYDKDKMDNLPNKSYFGSTKDEILFNVALSLCIRWINRILFLKLLEGQLLNYHNGDKSYKFLDSEKVKNFDNILKLFFSVLARKTEERKTDIQKEFFRVPYLNSSLFEITDLENHIIDISSLDSNLELPLYKNTVLKEKDRKAKRLKGKLSTLKYLLEFLNSYDFGAEEDENELSESNKTLINASVLGLIFEKINGYKDGSFYTPSFITTYMCRESISKAIIQKFNEKYNWDCENIDELEFLIFKKKVDLIEANNLVNSIKICDPAVGSGHFLVSALNEIIAIKSKLSILCDAHGNRLLIQIENKNDELDIRTKNEDIFEYKVKSHTNYDPVIREIPNESTKIQKALFLEKKHLIENCLFGVDINQNSVMICRLRLWIELLKNAYYTEESNYTELETLPNIDINIKQGNSLISRYALDADLKDALKKSKWNITSYRLAVTSYQSAKTKDEKREMEKLINEIKSNFKTEIQSNDKRFRKLRDLELELFNLTNQELLFERSKKELKEWNDKVSKLTEQVKKQEEMIEEIKNSVIYKDAFEWRFEFPEVLDEKGNFVGFDVVIGNPPYGINLSNTEKNFLKSQFTLTSGEVEIYTLFIELAISTLLKKDGYFSYITTNTIYYLDKFSTIRKNCFLKYKIISLLELEKKVFADAPDIVPAIYVLQKTNANPSDNIRLFKSKETKTVYDLVNFQEFSLSQIEQSKFEHKDNYIFSLFTNEKKENLLSKLSLLKTVKEYYKVIYGIKTGNNNKFLSKEINGNYNWKKCASSAKNIKKYIIDWQGDYLNVCSELAGLNNINYEQPKILIQYIRKISMPIRLVCALDTVGELYPLNNFSFIISNKGYSLKVLLGILNSNLMNWYFSNSFVDYNIKPKYIEKLPLPESLVFKELEQVVDRIITYKSTHSECDTKEIENKINMLVYKLYNLTEEEIKIIEGII